MTDSPIFDRTPPTGPDTVEWVSPRLRRIVAPNPSPFTFTGTCTYVVGHGQVAVVDPGPEDATHLAAILDAVRGETVTAILVTHTHRDHSPAAAALRAATGARTYAEGPHRGARPLAGGESNLLDASADQAFSPDIRLADGDKVCGPDWTLTAVTTPGHCANHLAFALAEDAALLSGDHVMAWSTSIVAPPDGAMGDYMASLRKLLDRDERIYFPGHGGPVKEPASQVRALIQHRRMREAAILQKVADGHDRIAAIVARVYEGLAPALMGAAALNTFAHLEELVARGAVKTDGAPSLDGRYWPGG